MVGNMLAHYRLIEKLGAGGMGEVYRAHDEQLRREVAIKVLPASSFMDPAARAQLVREARLAAALNHPHICTIYEVGEAPPASTATCKASTHPAPPLESALLLRPTGSRYLRPPVRLPGSFRSGWAQAISSHRSGLPPASTL